MRQNVDFVLSKAEMSDQRLHNGCLFKDGVSVGSLWTATVLRRFLVVLTPFMKGDDIYAICVQLES